MPEWIRWDKSMCASCWATCCHKMPVEVSVRDLIRLEVLTEEEAASDLPRAARRLKREGIVRGLKPRSLVFVLAQKPGGDCIFLGPDRRCTVYRRRPEICRVFPKMSPKPGHCPYKRYRRPRET